jgi:hypothetical protein
MTPSTWVVETEFAGANPILDSQQLERLAAHGEELTVPAGATLVEAGFGPDRSASERRGDQLGGAGGDRRSQAGRLRQQLIAVEAGGDDLLLEESVAGTVTVQASLGGQG